MTRETTVGVAVATSFVSLVAVVVAARLAQKPEQAAPKGDVTVVAQGPKKDDLKKPVERDKSAGQPGEKSTKATAAVKERVATPNSKQQRDVIQAAFDNTPPPPANNPPGPPPPLVADPVADLVNNSIEKLTAQADKGLTKPAQAVNNAAVSVDTTKNNVNATAEELQAQIEKDKKALQAANPGPGLPATEVEVVVGPQKKSSVSVAEAPVPPPPAAPPLVAAPPMPTVPAAANVNVPLPNPAPPPMPPVNANTVKLPEPPPPAAPAPTNPPNPSPSVTANVPSPGVPIVGPPLVTAQQPVAVAQVGAPKRSSPAGNDVPPPAPVPPIGSVPQATSPPIPVIKSQASAADVRSFDVESTRVQPGDQSFADLSRRIYRSDQYARALAMFNRDHPLATDGMKQNPPQLRPGDPVYFPGIDVLQAKYPQAFTATAPPVNNPAPPVQFGTTTPVTPTPGNPSIVAQAPPGTKTGFGGPGPGNTYRVRDGGESLFAIAQSMYGDGNRWTQIYRLNPDVQPQFPVPAGTVLKLPPAGN